MGIDRWFLRRQLIRVNQLLCRFIPVPKVKELNARLIYHRRIDISHPQKLNEKILWIEYHTDQSVRSRLSDKYEVRSYVREKGYGKYLVPVYGIYNSTDEIDFETLPEQFVLKATHGSDMNYICREKKAADVREMKRKLKRWMKTNMAYMSLEMHYQDIRPRILCEKYIDSGNGMLMDYKIHCCDGKARFILVCSYWNQRKFLDVFDTEWNHLPVVTGAEQSPVAPIKPKEFGEMCRIAEDLAVGIPFARIDLYMADNRIYFSEMTFTPATGLLFHFSDDFLLEQGKYCTISDT